MSDNWKKYPLLIVGELGVPLPGAIPLPERAIGQTSALPIHDFYVLVAVGPADTAAVLAKLEAAKLGPEQILVLLPPDTAFQHPLQPFLGVIDAVEGETADELRARLTAKLEGQRQKKLFAALQAAADSDIARRLGDSELQLALDSTRLAHALACAYSLSPCTHGRVLQNCLAQNSPLAQAWPNDLPLERVIVETAFLLVGCQARGLPFREALKEKCAALPFTTRNELLHHLETCVSFILGGRHAA